MPQQVGVILIQSALLTACHAHCAPVETLIVPVPPVTLNFSNAGEILNRQSDSSLPVCVMVKVDPAIVTLPWRGKGDRLSLTA